MTAADYLTDFSTTDDALVLASVSSTAEFDLLNDWLHAQRRAHPDTKVEVLQLPARGSARRRWSAQLVERARRRRGPLRRAGAGVLGAGRPAHPGQGRRR